MAHSFDSCRLKIERANEQIEHLKQIAKRFRDTDPYRVVTETDQQTGEIVFRVRIQRDIPLAFNLVTGEVLQSLRSALDYAVYSLSSDPTVRTGFPVYREASETEYKAMRTAKVKSIPSEARDYIDSLKPYKGGNDGVWRLDQLNNRDKHRLLLTAALGLRHIVTDIRDSEVPPLMLLHLSTHYRRQGIAMPTRWRMTPGPTRRVFPLYDGAELHRHNPSLRRPFQGDKQLDFAFDIAFNELGIVEGEPVIPLLCQTLALVTEITTKLATFT